MMKNFFFILTLTFFCSCINSSKNFELLTTWTKDFTISVYEGGGMNYASTKVVITSDSIIYTEMENGKDDVRKCKINASDQQQILSKLTQLNVGNISTVKTDGITYDKGTTEICFKISKSVNHCLANSASQEIKEKYAKNFGDIYNFILNFAQTKTK